MKTLNSSCESSDFMLPITILLKNNKNIDIRRAHPGDQYEYANVVNTCYLETRFLSRCADDEPLSAESLLGFIEDVETSNEEVLLLAEYEGKIAGFGQITACLNRRKMKHKCDLDISVLKDYWNLGIGTALMTSLIEFSRSAGYEQINLSVASDNERAIRLYEHLGFQITGKEIHAMKHGDNDYSDFVFMTRYLT